MAGARDQGNFSATTAEWLESPCLAHVARRVAHQHDLVRDDLEDLIQELRIALWEAGLDVRVTARWLFQVANHKAVDLFRKRVRHRRRDRVFTDIKGSASHDLELDHLLHARVARFSPSLRKFYDLRYLQGLSEREIARSLGLCRGSVRWLDRCCRRELAGQSSA
jgi:RNA polymerase sigma factor (sigma-70 family)